MWIELPGRIDLPAIRSAGVSPEALQRHYVFVTEYLWGVLEPDFENGQAVTVLDVQGLGMRDLAGEALGFVKVYIVLCFVRCIQILLYIIQTQYGV